MTSSQSPEKRATPRRPPASSPEARENQLVDLAINLAEEQLENGTASAQVVTHFLKLATVREKLEQQRLAAEIELSKMKIETMASNKRMETVYEEALDAMKRYSGQD